jgi:hypothetical protein
MERRLPEKGENGGHGDGLNYLLIYRDNRDSTHIQWVELRPDSAWIYGSRQSYTGSVIVRNWDGRPIKQLAYGMARAKKVKNDMQKTIIPVSITRCIRVSYPGSCTCSQERKETIGCDFETCDTCGGDECWDETIYMEVPGPDPSTEPDDDELIECTEPAPQYPGETPATPCNVPGPGGSGGPGAGPGGGSGPVVQPNPYAGLNLHPFILGLSITLSLSGDEAIYLSSNTDVAFAVDSYLSQNPISSESIAFAKWAVGYLMENQNTPNFDPLYELDLLTFQEGSDLDAPSIDWNTYTEPQQKQPMPAFATLSSNWPQFADSKGRASSPAVYVYGLAGGQLGDKFGNTGYRNACAIRGSICLNNSGYPIPNINGTEKGNNNLNFILKATDFRTYLSKNFVGPKARLDITAGMSITQMKNWLKANGGKTGIYITKNKNATTANYSGHVDLILQGLIINGYNLNPKGGVEYIEIW